MSHRLTGRYCADAEAINALKRDGLGWGHDLECGCFHDLARPPKQSGLARILARFQRRQ